jgi:hypothetical protein
MQTVHHTDVRRTISELERLLGLALRADEPDAAVT